MIGNSALRLSTPMRTPRQDLPQDLQRDLQALLENPFGSTSAFPNPNGFAHIPFNISRSSSPDNHQGPDEFISRFPSSRDMDALIPRFPTPPLTIDPRLLRGATPQPQIKSESSSEYDFSLEPSPKPERKPNPFASTSAQTETLTPKEAANRAKQEALNHGATEAEAMKAYHAAYRPLYRRLPKVTKPLEKALPGKMASKARQEALANNTSKEEANSIYNRVYQQERKK